MKIIALIADDNKPEGRAENHFPPRYDFTQADLEAMLPRLREVFSAVGMDFDACMEQGMIGFERMSEAMCSASEAVLKLSQSMAELQSKTDFACLRETAWERRNTNAPWWRQFQSKQRCRA